MSARKQKTVKSTGSRSKYASVFVGELLDEEIANRAHQGRYPVSVS
jgi:hypothetical protein